MRNAVIGLVGSGGDARGIFSGKAKTDGKGESETNSQGRRL